MKERFRDDYFVVTKDKEEFLSELSAIRADSEWIPSVPGNELQISSILPIEVTPMSIQYGIDAPVLLDTADRDGTQLLLHMGYNQVECVRNTAYSGLLQTAVGLSGPGLSRLWKRSSQHFCECLNEFLRSQNGNLKLYKSCGKISGVFSSNYNEMEILDLITIAEEALEPDMGTAVFRSGHIEHSLTGCSWEFPEVEYELMKKYRDLIEEKTKVYGINYIPVVELITSNTGASTASLIPMFCAPGKVPFRVGNGVRIRHDNRQIGTATGCGLEAFKDQAATMFSMFNDGIEALERMTHVTMANVQNAFISACNWCFGERLPRKLAAAALETFLELNGDEPCSMYDLFMAISDINYEAEKANVTFDRKVEISECIARLLKHRNWAEFDIFGAVAWNGTKGGT